MVFGSQQGGGIAVVGGGGYTRGANSSVAARTAADNAIFYLNRDTWLDGEKVNPTTTGFNGAWQLLDFVKGEGDAISALGMNTGVGDANLPCGGQNYAEVIFFPDELTEFERVSVERYLARKWGLDYPAAGVRLGVAAGATVTVDCAADLAELHGAGEVRVTDVAGGRLPDACFSGKLKLTGGTWALSGAAIPEDVSAIAATHRIGWFDPSDISSSVRSEKTVRSMSVWGLLDRDDPENGVYLHGTYNGAMGTDRRPWLNARSAPWLDAGSLYWLDFRTCYGADGDTSGKVMRFKRDHSRIKSEDYSSVTLDVRAAFIVTDSSRGGGMPLSDTSGFTNLIKHRTPAHDLSATVWNKESSPRVRQGKLRFDGEPRKASSATYSGRPEVMSFVSSADYDPLPVSFVGDLKTVPGDECLGEMIFFDVEPSEDESADIEAYLMGKWLGKARAGYVRYADAEVDGTANLSAATLQSLPKFAATFSGSVTMTGSELSAVLDSQNPQAVLSAPGAQVILPNSGTLNVSLSSRPKAGSYPLIVAAEILGGDNLTLSGTASELSGVRLAKSAESLSLVVSPQGSLLLLR